MKKLLLPFLLFLVTHAGRAQKVELLHRSAFRHNYAIGRFHYIEKAADTSRLKYVAKLRIHQENYPYIMSNFVERFKTEGKDLGANMFILDSFEARDSAITVTVRCYFAPEKFFDVNKANMDKSKIYVFSSERRAAYEQTVFINDSAQKFLSTCFLQFAPAEGDYLKVGSTKSGALPGFQPSKGKKFKAGKESLFYVIGENTPNESGIIPTLAIAGATALMTGGTTVLIVKRTPTCGTLPYQYARILLDIYKPYLK